MEYEGMVYRPPSEAYSLIIQVTIGCSQNDCIFCNMYKEKSFRMRPLDEVLADFREARAYYSSIGKIFLADGDALICKNEYLNEILKYIREEIPECRQVTCYASPRSVIIKKEEELRELKENGLDMVYMGLESGNAQVLEFMKKGATPEEMKEAAAKIKQAGIRLSVTAISGLGGKRLWREHAVDTGKVLSAMKPDYVGLLTLMVEPGLPLEEKIQNGEFELISPYDNLKETKVMLENMDCPGCIFRSNHASNYVNLKGTLNEDRERMIAQLEEAIQGNVHLKEEWMRGF
ncbi:radical SAM protein [Anaerostipes sp.]|uniref:radical SAM protein n=1 Tax=Anaerostipes sp. TaxID=1872530 RepID=UPI0025BE0CFB|nr:radical SAM protein [Anaerostipes sp.]MBS7008425.1 B12-binding domain-containing radical SAM protein [Anaerostipes sp.]